MIVEDAMNQPEQINITAAAQIAVAAQAGATRAFILRKTDGQTTVSEIEILVRMPRGMCLTTNGFIDENNLYATPEEARAAIKKN